MTEFTPVEDRNGLLYKREDLYSSPLTGVNGAKYRACQYLVSQSGAEQVVSASSVLSPQSAIAATVCAEQGLPLRVIVGGTTPEKAVRHPAIALAKGMGAEITAISVGYNPALQKAALAAAEEPGVWRLPYGITTPPDASSLEIEEFLQVGAAQVDNLPDELETLVLPFGSGNTACGVLRGLKDKAPENLQRVVLMGIGPDRLEWARERLGGQLVPDGVDLQHVPLHGWYAEYGDRMPETLDDVVLHPTYEGKVARYLNGWGPDWWTRRDGTTCFWIVGGLF